MWHGVCWCAVLEVGVIIGSQCLSEVIGERLLVAETVVGVLG